MAYELVFTSVPQGIRSGSTGFCTVAYTNGLAANLVMQLESISGYKPFFPHYDPHAADNPVAFSHCTLTDTTGIHHVLSRICFYGLDYTKRSNKLAHHVILSDQENTTLPGNPAAISSQPDFFRQQWQEAPTLFRSQKHLPHVAPRQQVQATRWGEYTGDPGWAGRLVQAFMDNPQRPAFVIYDPLKHTNILELVDEALELMPASRKWDVTYNTYVTVLPAGITCSWRFCTPNADCLADARRLPNTLIIDLTSDLGNAGTGTFVDIARSGQKPQEDSPVIATICQADSTPTDQTPEIQEDTTLPIAPMPDWQPQQRQEEPIPTLPPPRPLTTPAPQFHPQRPYQPQGFPYPPPRRPQSDTERPKPIVAYGAIFLFLILLVGGGLLLKNRQEKIGKLNATLQQTQQKVTALQAQQKLAESENKQLQIKLRNAQRDAADAKQKLADLKVDMKLNAPIMRVQPNPPQVAAKESHSTDRHDNLATKVNPTSQHDLSDMINRATDSAKAPQTAPTPIKAKTDQASVSKAQDGPQKAMSMFQSTHEASSKPDKGAGMKNTTGSATITQTAPTSLKRQTGQPPASNAQDGQQKAMSMFQSTHEASSKPDKESGMKNPTGSATVPQTGQPPASNAQDGPQKAISSPLETFPQSTRQKKGPADDKLSDADLQAIRNSAKRMDKYADKGEHSLEFKAIYKKIKKKSKNNDKLRKQQQSSPHIQDYERCLEILKANPDKYDYFEQVVIDEVKIKNLPPEILKIWQDECGLKKSHLKFIMDLYGDKSIDELKKLLTKHLKH